MARACPPVGVFRSRSEATTRGGICLSSRAERNGKALSFLIVLTLALGGVFATVVALTPVARAGTCDQVGGVITQTWTITTTQVCTDILYTVDATININSGGSLTLVNGGGPGGCWDRSGRQRCQPGDCVVFDDGEPLRISD